MRTHNRSGLTLLDVVVVIILMLILAAVFLPATRSSGGASRRSDCKNKLKQIGLALHNYEETHKTFPPGWVSVRGPGSGDQEQSAYGWGTYILPFLDQAPLFKKIQYGSDNPTFQAEAQRPDVRFAATHLPALVCPSSRGDLIDKSSSIPEISTSNYVGNFGVGIPVLHQDSLLTQGVFGCNSKVRIRDLRDGTTNVVLVGERIVPLSGLTWPLHDMSGPFNSYWAGIPRGTNPLAVVATVTDGEISESGSEDALNIQGKLNGFHRSQPRVRGLLINKTASGRPLNSKAALGQDASAGFSSYHPGGAQILLGDASVRFVSDSVDPNTWINLMRRSDGVTLGEF